MTDRLTEEEAAKLWQRAAQLQADALERADAPEDQDENAEAHDDSTEGYALSHVREAAIEAGIAAEYLDAALADVQAERAIHGARRSGRITRLLLGDPPDAVTVRRTIEAPPRNVLAAMEAVFVREAYQLSLTDRQGDALNGGLLTFKIEGASFYATEGFKGQASAADLREVLVTIRPAGEGAGATDLTIRGPVAWAHRIQAASGSVAVGIAGGVGLGLGWLSSGAIITSLLGAGPIAAPVLGLIAAGVTLGAGGVAGGLGLQGFRAIYDYQIEKGRAGLETLLSVVAVEAQGGWALDPDRSVVAVESTSLLAERTKDRDA